MILVSFVDTQTMTGFLIRTRQGGAPEELAIHISFEADCGAVDISGGARQTVPGISPPYQAGRHDYVSHRQGEKIWQPEVGSEGRERLARWLEQAWKADCLITGQGEEERRRRSFDGRE